MTNPLYLFDIDFTLVDATNAHIQAYNNAYQTVFKTQVPKDKLLSKFGLPEIKIHEQICQELKIPFTISQLEELIVLWESNFLSNTTPDNIKVLPGVTRCLQALNDLGSPKGVATGNTRNVGTSILEKANLSKYFPIQSYDEGARDRVEIVQNAIQQAEELGYKSDRLIIIGDSPSDIKAGKSLNARTVGVATGQYNSKALKQAGADLTLESLSEYQTILDL